MTERQNISNIIISGGCAGIISDFAMHSLDTVKIRQQAQLTNLAKNKYKSIFQSFAIILKEEGIRGLYGGIWPALVGSIASNTVYFATYETIKHDLIENNIHPTTAYFISGGIADAFAAFIYVPTEVLKLRMQLQGKYNNPHSISPHNYKGSIHALSSIYYVRGFSGIYHGLGATLLRDVPYTAIQFSIYETMKSKILLNQPTMNFKQEILCGICAGFIAGFFTTPLDVIKTYLQTQKRTTVLFVPSNNIQLAPHYSGIFSAAKGIYKRAGIKALFTGALPRSMTLALHSMIIFVAYENFQYLFQNVL